MPRNPERQKRRKERRRGRSQPQAASPARSLSAQPQIAHNGAVAPGVPPEMQARLDRMNAIGIGNQGTTVTPPVEPPQMPQAAPPVQAAPQPAPAVEPAQVVQPQPAVAPPIQAQPPVAIEPAPAVAPQPAAVPPAQPAAPPIQIGPDGRVIQPQPMVLGQPQAIDPALGGVMPQPAVDPALSSPQREGILSGLGRPMGLPDRAQQFAANPAMGSRFDAMRQFGRRA